MGVKHKQRYCPQDKRYVLAVKQTPNHLLHLILSIVTAGAWLPIWLILILLAWARPWICQNCGTSTWSRMPRLHNHL